MMRQTSLLATLLDALLSEASVGAFAPATSVSRRPAVSSPTTPLHMFGEEGEEPKKLTRDSEPEEYFSSNMDKMSDGEKLPVALAGLAFVSLPFIAGLIALYAAK